MSSHSSARRRRGQLPARSYRSCDVEGVAHMVVLRTCRCRSSRGGRVYTTHHRGLGSLDLPLGTQRPRAALANVQLLGCPIRYELGPPIVGARLTPGSSARAVKGSEGVVFSGRDSGLLDLVAEYVFE